MPRALVSQLKPLFNHRYARNITYRTMTRSDAFPLYQATRDPAFNRFLLWNAPTLDTEIFPQVDKLLRAANQNKSVVLSMCEKDTGTWIGIVILKPFRDGLEMSLYLHPSRWNTGIVFPCGRGVIETALQANPDIPLYVRMHPDNLQMEKICKAYGFVPTEGDTAQHDTNGVLNLLVYRLDQHAWKKFDKLYLY